MIDLADVSKIGLGTYRMSISDTDHLVAGLAAIERGCNLIDTSCNYMGGESELLVGKLLIESKKNLFIVSKGGYLNIKNFQYKEVHDLYTTQLGKTVAHTLDPIILNTHLEETLRRLGRDYLDGYLLHNPEYYLKHRVQDAQTYNTFYGFIEDIFIWLEKMVTEGKIRYYGISSNTLPYNTSSKSVICLKKLVKIAQSITRQHHFKLVQFPHNIIENSAVQNVHADGKSLIEIIKDHNLKSFANRPLNANFNGGGIRLAEYDCSEIKSLIPLYNEAAEKLLICINNKTEYGSLALPDNAKDFLSSNLLPNNIHHHDYIFGKTIKHFIDEAIGNGVLYSNVITAYEKAEELSRKIANVRANKISQQIKSQLDDTEFDFKHSASDKLQDLLCKYYLESGIDHVLVGMRSKPYTKVVSYCQ